MKFISSNLSNDNSQVTSINNDQSIMKPMILSSKNVTESGQVDMLKKLELVVLTQD